MTIPGGYNAGDVLTATNMNLLPAGEIGYAQVTANQASITSEADLTSLTVTFTAVAGRRYKVIAYVEVTPTVADGVYVLNLKESTTVLKRATDPFVVTSSVTGSLVYSNNASISGSKTWKLTLQKVGGTGSLTMSASSTSPAFILVEDIGLL